MTTPQRRLYRDSERDDETKRLNREHLLVEIEKYSSMSIHVLVDVVASYLTYRREDLVVEVFHFLKWLIQLIRKQEHSLKALYPKVYDGNSLFGNYIHDVQRALCEKGWLCNVMASDSDLSYVEQIDTIWRYLRDHPHLQRWSGRVYKVPVAILITRIGPQKFCGCKNGAEVKP